MRENRSVFPQLSLVSETICTDELELLFESIAVEGFLRSYVLFLLFAWITHHSFPRL